MVIIQALFKRIRYNKDINRQTRNRWLMNINMILRCLVQNLTEDAKLTQWNDVVSSVNLIRDEMFSVVLLHILHDVVLQILTNTRQLRGQMDMILVSLASDYRYLFMCIMENGNQSKQQCIFKQFRTIVNDLCQLLSSIYIPLLLQWT
ncbi:unnamed protein product [Rotaria sp. Silwood2]|nr:unnamed protein product [Rotaria sp. Silwood2]